MGTTKDAGRGSYGGGCRPASSFCNGSCPIGGEAKHTSYFREFIFYDVDE